VDKQNRRSPFHFVRKLRRSSLSTPSHVGLCLLPWHSFLSMCARAHRDLVLHILNLCKILGSFPLSPLFRVKRGKEGRSNRVIECILNEFLVATGRTLSNLRDVDIAVQPCAVKYLSRRDALTMTQCFLRLIKKPRVPTKSAHAAKKSGRG